MLSFLSFVAWSRASYDGSLRLVLLYSVYFALIFDGYLVKSLDNEEEAFESLLVILTVEASLSLDLHLKLLI